MCYHKYPYGIIPRHFCNWTNKYTEYPSWLAILRVVWGLLLCRWLSYTSINSAWNRTNEKTTTSVASLLDSFMQVLLTPRTLICTDVLASTIKLSLIKGIVIEMEIVLCIKQVVQCKIHFLNNIYVTVQFVTTPFSELYETQHEHAILSQSIWIEIFELEHKKDGIVPPKRVLLVKSRR